MYTFFRLLFKHINGYKTPLRQMGNLNMDWCYVILLILLGWTMADVYVPKNRYLSIKDMD